MAKDRIGEKRSLNCTQEADRQWYNAVRQNYEAIAAGLLADGYERRHVTDIRHEIFVRGDQAVMIVRRLASTDHYTVETQVE